MQQGVMLAMDQVMPLKQARALRMTMKMTTTTMMGEMRMTTPAKIITCIQGGRCRIETDTPTQRFSVEHLKAMLRVNHWSEMNPSSQWQHKLCKHAVALVMTTQQ